MLITYDLNKPGKDYDSLYLVIKSTSKAWWHYLDSTWLVATQEDVGYWQRKIREVVDQNDHFLVVEITKMPRQGWLPQKAWDWIKKYES